MAGSARPGIPELSRPITYVSLFSNAAASRKRPLDPRRQTNLKCANEIGRPSWSRARLTKREAQNLGASEAIRGCCYAENSARSGDAGPRAQGAGRRARCTDLRSVWTSPTRSHPLLISLAGNHPSLQSKTRIVLRRCWLQSRRRRTNVNRGCAIDLQ